MKMTIVQTDRVVERHGVPCRVWEGLTPDDMRYEVYVQAMVMIDDVGNRLLVEPPPAPARLSMETFPAFRVTDTWRWFNSPIAELDLAPADVEALTLAGIATIGRLAVAIGEGKLMANVPDVDIEVRVRIRLAYLSYVGGRARARYDLDLSEAVRDAERRKARGGDGPCLDPNL